MGWETVAEFIRHNLLRASLVLAASLIGLQFETGPWGDFFLSLVLFGLVAYWGYSKGTRT